MRWGGIRILRSSRREAVVVVFSAGKRGVGVVEVSVSRSMAEEGMSDEAAVGRASWSCDSAGAVGMMASSSVSCGVAECVLSSMASSSGARWRAVGAGMLVVWVDLKAEVWLLTFSQFACCLCRRFSWYRGLRSG